MTSNKISLENIQVCLLLCLLALGANLFVSVSIIGDTKLMLGSSFVFLAFKLLPIRLGFFVASCALLSQIVVSTLWTIPFIFVVEMLIIIALLHRGIYLIIASLLFWTFIGLPLLWTLNFLTPLFTPLFAELSTVNGLADENLIMTFQVAFNGLLNAGIAAFIYIFIPHGWFKERRIKQNKLSSNIFVICSSTMVVPVLVTSFAFIAQQIYHKEKALLNELESKALFISKLTNAFLHQHQQVIEQLAASAQTLNNVDNFHQLMLHAQRNNPTFFNITIADENGDLGFFAPAKYNEQVASLPKSLRTIKDRSYFKDAIRTQQTVTSEVILSKGVVKQPMISLATPKYSNIGSQQNVSGVIFGTINLSSLGNFQEELQPISENNNIIITDQFKRIVYSNNPEIYQTLDKFTYLPTKSSLIESIPFMLVDRQSYLYKKQTTESQWSVYVTRDSEDFISVIREQFILVGLSLLLILSAFLYIAFRLTRRITAPLNTLLINEGQVSTEWLNSSDTSEEFCDMAKKLKRSTYLMQNYEKRLKFQVNERTERLRQHNQQLSLQARLDGLTKLLNRSGFNELVQAAIKTSYRNQQSFSLALLDLDNFKVINDTYGHPFGDKCLMAFAQLMQTHCKRDTDLIGRYGGEEFIIYLASDNIESQHDIIKKLHEDTHSISIADTKSGKLVRFTVSIGVCTSTAQHVKSLSELIELADQELYKCKRNGRDQISFHIMEE